MPTVTALRELPGGRVAVELDGSAWRTLPVDAVVGAELRVGVELDRPRARSLRRELRRGEAQARALRALRARDRSAHELGERLVRAGVGEELRSETVARLERAGLVDDERVAHTRAAALAERGHGDAAIRWDLERRGLQGSVVERALRALEPEEERAARIAARRGCTPATARLLARRGFGEDAIAAAVGTEV